MNDVLASIDDELYKLFTTDFNILNILDGIL